MSDEKMTFTPELVQGNFDFLNDICKEIHADAKAMRRGKCALSPTALDYYAERIKQVAETLTAALADLKAERDDLQALLEEIVVGDAAREGVSREE